ncbi:MAG TPA: hypothetical protein VIH52_02195 [Candidatus Nanoarchaeia archaeon]|nr:hypothetical protein [uncultured archaeon]
MTTNSEPRLPISVEIYGWPDGQVVTNRRLLFVGMTVQEAIAELDKEADMSLIGPFSLNGQPVEESSLRKLQANDKLGAFTTRRTPVRT